MMMKAAWLAFTLVLASALPAPAEELGRYSLVPAGEGFLRLDTGSGAVSFCGRRSAGWACERLSDDAAPGGDAAENTDRLDKEIGGLRDRLAKAEADLAASKAANTALAARADAAEKAAQDAKAEAEDAARRVAKAEQDAEAARSDAHAAQPRALDPLVPQQAVDELSEFLGKLMRRLQEMARDLQRDQSERAL